MGLLLGRAARTLPVGNNNSRAFCAFILYIKIIMTVMIKREEAGSGASTEVMSSAKRNFGKSPMRIAG